MISRMGRKELLAWIKNQIYVIIQFVQELLVIKEVQKKLLFLKKCIKLQVAREQIHKNA